VADQKKEVINHFDSWSATYEAEVWHRDEFFHKNLQRWVFNSIEASKDQVILELGVGPGVYYEKFLQGNHKVIGIDVSFKMIQVTSKKLKEKGYNTLNFVLGDGEFLPFKEETFDITNCIEVLRHLPQPYKTIWRVFRELRRVISQDGDILVNLPNILFPLNLVSVIYYMIPRFFTRLFNKKIGFQYDQNVSFPHFPVLYNEPEDHMYNILFIRSLIRNTKLKAPLLKGVFFFPACPKLLFSLFKKIDRVLGLSPFTFLAYAFLIKLKRV